MDDRTCNLCNKPLLGQQKRFCSHACANRHSSALRSAKAKTYQWPTCCVEDCGMTVRSRQATMCAKHYHRVYRYGSANPIHAPKYIDISGHKFNSLTAIERLANGNWLCRCECGNNTEVNVGNLNNGTHLTCGDKKTHYRRANNYAAAHAYVRQDKGPAKRYACVDCKAPARHWAYSHQDPDEQRDWSMKGAPYFSTNPDYYEPRCVPCHKAMDLQVAKQRTLADR